MSNNPISIAPIASLVRRHLVASLGAFRKKKAARTAGVAKDLWLSIPSSEFDQVGSTGFAGDDDEDVSPLTEAEIYVIFGRRKDAEAVLGSALRSGRIKAEEIAAFWLRMASERDCPADC
ncbi:hypothetical protein ACLIKD_16615 [Azonexus sp. IMCC34842]|uniref:hypothetical protein n=1 Tax=Azonexus sp. IMCC34842 TaxID=3420950 RepID=UPI003D09930C